MAFEILSPTRPINMPTHDDEPYLECEHNLVRHFNVMFLNDLVVQPLAVTRIDSSVLPLTPRIYPNVGVVEGLDRVILTNGAQNSLNTSRDGSCGRKLCVSHEQ